MLIKSWLSSVTECYYSETNFLECIRGNASLYRYFFYFFDFFPFVKSKSTLKFQHLIGVTKLTNSLTFYHYRSISNKVMHSANGNIRRITSGKSSLKFSHINVRGALREKSADIDLILSKYKVDILGISESNQLKDDFIQTNDKNYVFEPCFNYTDTKTRLGVYIKNSLNYNEIMYFLTLSKNNPSLTFL